MATEKLYSGDGSDTTFDITFPYLTHADIKVSLKELKSGATTPYDANDYHYVNKSDPGDYSISVDTITFTTAPPNGTGLLENNIKITRATVITSPEHEYTAGSSITAAKLNENQKQALYAIQEAGEITATPGGISTGDKGPIFVSSDSSWAMQANSIANTHLQDNAVDTAEIKANAVTTNKIASNNVTMDKLGSGALPTDITVASANLVNGTIATEDITLANITRALLETDLQYAFNPVGTVIWYAGNTAPTGYLKANGDSIANGSGTTQSITTDFSALYAIVGANLPDLRGEFIRGWDDGKGTDSGRGIRTSQTDDNKTHTHTTNTTTTTDGSSTKLLEGEFQGESQTFSPTGVFSTNGNASRDFDSGTGKRIKLDATHNHGMTDSGGTEARPRNVALLACIKY